MSISATEQTIKFLSDLYSIERQALAQLKDAAKVAGESQLREDLNHHYAQTHEHSALVGTRLKELGGSSSFIKESIMKVGGKGFLLFAKSLSETPGRLLAHSYAYEAMEWAGYEALIHMAENAGDLETAELARHVQQQEEGMMLRLEKDFSGVEEHVHQDVSPTDLQDHVKKHLTEMHALESQSLKLLEHSQEVASGGESRKIYQEHAEETHRQQQDLEQRLHELATDKSLIEDAALKFGALQLSVFLKSQADTPPKMAAFAYAFEHLEIAAYELLLRTAQRAVDSVTERLAKRHLDEEREMGRRIRKSMGLIVRQASAAASN